MLKYSIPFTNTWISMYLYIIILDAVRTEFMKMKKLKLILIAGKEVIFSVSNDESGEKTWQLI